jgi:hypothetical protein
MINLKYPIGKFSWPSKCDENDIKKWIDEIEELPHNLFNEVRNLTEAQLDTPYRPGGWKVRQVIHHLADSHMNCLVRFKWTLTEDVPTIKPYFEDRWAELTDYTLVPIEVSLDFIKFLHIRMVTLFRSLKKNELAKQYFHPETGSKIDLARNIALYAWHGKHHLAHITTLIQREGWR